MRGRSHEIRTSFDGGNLRGYPLRAGHMGLYGIHRRGRSGVWDRSWRVAGDSTFFSLIELLGNVLYWRLYGRRIALSNALKFLKTNKFPPREYEHDTLLAYLARIQDGPEYPSPLRAAAAEAERLLTFIEQLGIGMGARNWDVWCAALDAHAPGRKQPAIFNEPTVALCEVSL